MNEWLKPLAKMLKPFWKQMLVLLAMTIVMQAVGLVYPFVTGKIVDAVFNRESMAEIWKLIGFGAGAMILQGCLFLWIKESYETKQLDVHIRRYFSFETLKKMLGFSIGQHNNENSGLKQSIVARGEHSLVSLIYSVLYDSLPQAIQVIGLSIAIFWIDPLIGIITVGGGAAFILCSLEFNRKFMPALKKIQEQSNDNDRLHSEILRNAILVEANSQETKVLTEFDYKISDWAQKRSDLLLSYISFNSGRNLISAVTKSLIIAVGAYEVLAGARTAGSLVTIFQISGILFNVINNFGGYHKRYADYLVAIRKYLVLSNVETDIKIIQNPVRPERLFGKIEFRNVSFQYPKDRYLLDEEIGEQTAPADIQRETLELLNFIIEPGQRVAIVGHSGSGKSTIAQMLIRAYDPNQGQILIDDNDLRLLDLFWYRKQIGLVEQDVALFDQTLLYNIVFGLDGELRSLPEENLKEILHLSAIDRFSERLENGLETVIGERGVRLSGGERQRVGIARAIVKNPSILIFDEATSSLDSENEAIIRESIAAVSKNKTTIIIAHRLSTIKDVDKIFVLDQGRLVAEGTHQELAAACVPYQNLIKNQVVAI